MIHFLAALSAGLLLAGSARAQTVLAPDEAPELSRNSADGIYHFSWWGRAGITYFIEHSEDLLTWEYLPVIESGNDDVIQWGFTASTDHVFLRLKMTDAPTDGDPFSADFDGDGVSNWQELLDGTDPLRVLDTDNDGLPDTWEMNYLGTLAKGPRDSAGLGDGKTLRQAFEHGEIPTFYGDEKPTLTVVSGDRQWTVPGSPLPEPMVVRVSNSAGVAYRDVPMFFSVKGGSFTQRAELSSKLTTVQVRTNERGEAIAWGVAPETAGQFEVIVSTQASTTRSDEK